MSMQVTITAKSGSNAVRSDIDTWANARGQAIGKETTTFVQTTKTGGSYQVGRYFGNFDVNATGGVPKGSTIASVTFVHPVVGTLSNADSDTVYVVDHTGSDPIVVADFNNIDLNSDTTYGSIALSNLSTTETKNITLDSNGIAVVQTAVNDGTTLAKFCLRLGNDVNNVTPGGVTEYTMNVTAPQLIITYDPPLQGGMF